MSHKEYYYRIAGLLIRVWGRAEEIYPDSGYLSDFETEPGEPDRSYSLSVVERLPEISGPVVYSEPALCVVQQGQTLVTCYGAARPDDECIFAQSHAHTDETQILYARSGVKDHIRPRQFLRCLEAPHLITVHGGLLFHSAWICWKGRAILFTAPSGTGKSTQAELWCRHTDAELCNGDRSAIRVVGDDVMVCGVPYSGSSQVRENRIMPLGAIVYLSQAPENNITRLTGLRAFRRIWEGCTVPIWDRSDMTHATGTVSAVISRVPVYHLACTPDVRAVELLKQTLEVE